jgi:hypothetical protein
VPVKKPQQRIQPGYPFSDIWPLVSYSTELHELMEDFADPRNWHNGRYKKGDIRDLAQKAIQRASVRPQGPSMPIWWVTWACENGHTWTEVQVWDDTCGWKAAVSKQRNRAGVPICPECGQVDSPKARRRLGIE